MDSELLHQSKSRTVCAIFVHTALDVKIYDTKFYNLDAILSVGYRINSRKATQFNEEAILDNKGTVSNEVAMALAEKEYEKFNISLDRILESDFDKEIKKLQARNKKK